METGMTERIAGLKSASPLVAAMKAEEKNRALNNIAEELYNRRSEVFAANELDLAQAARDEIPSPIYKRLKFDEQKLNDVIEGINALVKLDDPVGREMLKTELDTGLVLQKVSCPIGVIGVIFESRPDALVQISTLCLKSGNAVIVKGGSEAKNTNRILSEIIKTAACKGTGLPENWIVPCETRAEIGDLLAMDRYIDLLIPRGSNEFIRYIMDNTKIPVMGHADGICHCFADESADEKMTQEIVVDAKTQYVAVCNALETLLVHEGAAASLLPATVSALLDKGVEVRGCRKTIEILEGATTAGASGATAVGASGEVDAADAADKASSMAYGIVPACDADWETEYLDNVISVKIVSGIDEAVSHINMYGSHHTDSIITNNKQNAEKFMLLVDSANVFLNCSTRFSDGFRYGFGAEVGISTGKLHARGPVGLDGLVSYKYLLYGKGHIVSDYSEKRRFFTHKKL